MLPDTDKRSSLLYSITNVQSNAFESTAETELIFFHILDNLSQGQATN